MIVGMIAILLYVLGAFITDEYMDMLAEMDDDKYELPIHYHYGVVLAWPIVTLYLKLFRTGNKE